MTDSWRFFNLACFDLVWLGLVWRGLLCFALLCFTLFHVLDFLFRINWLGLLCCALLGLALFALALLGLACLTFSSTLLRQARLCVQVCRLCSTAVFAQALQHCNDVANTELVFAFVSEWYCCVYLFCLICCSIVLHQLARGLCQNVRVNTLDVQRTHCVYMTCVSVNLSFCETNWFRHWENSQSMTAMRL